MTKINMNIDELKRAVLEKRLEEQLKAREGQQQPAFIKPANRHQPLPLSFAQQRLWFISQLDPAASQAYHLPVSLRLTGQLDYPALKASLDRLIARHESLRTRFVLVEGQPRQHIDPADIGFALSCHDLRLLDPALHTQRVAELADSEAQAPFDFTQGPLIRAQLLQLADDEHVLLLTLHHIITDGWSIGVLVQELVTFYRAALDGQPDPLPPLPIQYADYAVWQQEQLQGTAFTEQRDFWCSQLADAPALLTLPTDRPRPAVQTYAGNQVPVHIDADLLASLKELGQRHHTTLFMTVLSAWGLVLARLSGQNDIVIGTPVANRPHQELEGLMGFFVNTLALRISCHDNFRVTDLLAQVRERALAAYSHQDLPFEQVVEALQPERSLSYNPLFQVMLALNNTPAQELSLPGLQLTTIAQEHHSTHFDLTLSLSETEAGLVGELEYATDLFDAATVERIAGYFNNVLTAMVTDDTQLIATLPMLPASERQQLLVDFNATQIDFPQAALIHQLIEARAAQHSDTLAVIYEDQTLSYGELNHRANQLAHYLIALGVHPDDRVAICAERSLEMIVGFLAILKAGGAYVPLDPAYPSERLAYMLDDAAPVALLTQSGLTQSEWFVQFNTLPTVLLDNPEPCLANQPTDNPNPQALELMPHHLAYVIYTSGSTGQPKGVMVEHQSLCNLIATQQHTLSLTTDSRVLQFASNSFDASIWECCMALIAGARLYLAKRTHLLPGAILSRYLTDQAISHILLSPTALAAMDSLPDTLQTLLVGGEACPPTLVKRWSPGRQMLNAYGPTETTVCATLYPCISSDESATDNPPPIGRPIANTRIYILDAHGQPVPRGVAGEIYIAGAGVARGYLNRPELTTERFLTDPFSSQPDARMYKTGDLGRWLPEGNIEYLGRNDFQVKLRGFRIELEEIETQLSQCDGVREAIVLAREDEPGQKRLVAYLLPQEGVELVPAKLRQQLSQHLADYMLPSAFVTLTDFPLTPNGKLDRQALPAPDSSAVVTQGYEPPHGRIETALAQIWQDLLGLERVSRHDHFFELGGHSLMIVSLIEELRNLGWRLDVRSVFASPILTDMAQTIQHDTQAFVVPPNLIPEDCSAITPDMLPLVSLSQAEIDAIVDTVSGGARNVQDIYPLSPLQEGILFHHLLQTQGDNYLLQSLLAFDTRDRLDNFLTALQQVINRHDILRTAIFWQGLEQPVQVVWRQAQLDIKIFTPTAAQDDISAQLQAYTDPRQHRINLNHAPLFIANIAHDPIQDEWLLALRFHHLVSDHLTLELILTEIAQILRGNAKTLPTMLPYRNFIAQTLSVPVAEHEAYFRDQLADIDEPTTPFGILNVPSDNSAINTHRLPLNPTLAKAIRSQARRLGISPSVLFHVAWAQVLAHTSGRDDVVFGSVLLGRLQGGAGADRILGMFINTLPLRISLDGCSVQDIVQDTYHNLITLLEHEQTPLVLAQRCSGVEQPMPLFSSLLNYRHSSSGETEAVDTIWTGIRTLSAEERTNYPITLSVDDLGNGFQLTTQTISEIAPERINTYLATAISGLIDALVHNPQQRIRDIPILPAAERQQLLTGFNATQVDFPQETLLHQLIEAQVAKTPNATAVVYGNQSLSYEALNRHANRLAHHLIELGVHHDDRVAICVERSLEMVVGLLAILKAGGAYVPLDPAYPAERLTYMLDDAAPVVLLTQATLCDKLDSTVPVILLDNILNNPESFLAAQPADNPDAQALGLTSRHLAYVIYTSGSTGMPKGVMVEHANVIRLLAATQTRFQFDDKDVWTLFHSFAFDFSVWELWGALAYGGRLVVISAECARSPQLFYSLLCREHVTILNQTPSAFRSLIAAQGVEGVAEHALRCIIFGGEALELHTLVPWVARNPTAQTRLVNMYGITEITVHATYHELTEADIYSGRGSLIGQPLADLRIYILDPHGQPAPLGVAGEIYIVGDGVTRGYLNRPELTAERFLTDPFSSQPDARMYKTGDLGRWLPDGNIEYLGRNDFQVKLRGFRIELGEIEAKLEQCDGVREAVVLAREDEPGQKRLVAYLRPLEGAELIPAKLRQQLTQHLADYMLPSAFVTLETFPLTPNGKLDRQALPAPDLSAVVARGYEAPVGETEIALAQIWQKLLGLKQVSRHDHFFELGGHSLMIVSLTEELRKLGWQLDIRSVFSSPVLTDMAQAIQREVCAFAVPPNRIPEDCTAITPDMLPLVSLSQAEIDTLVEQIPGGAGNVQDIYPLAPLQEGILFHHLLQAQGDNYLLQSLLAFDTRERLDAFLAALQHVIDRHDILRTAAYWQDLAQPVQVVWRQASLIVREFIPASVGDIPAQLLAHTDPRQHRINLNQAPLFTADIAPNPAQDEWLLALRFHHLVSDHLTMELILAEITLILQGKTEKLPTVLPYRNFIAQILSVPITDHEAYFRAQLADINEPTAPFGILKVQTDNDLITEAHLSIAPDLAKAIRTQARRFGVSPSVLFHVAWAQVLAHTSGRDDVVFGSVLLGRLQGGAGSDQILGMFINTLPLRISLTGRTVQDIVQDTYHNLTTLLEHEQSPLVLAQQCSGVELPMPLFSTLFNYRHGPSNETAEGETEAVDTAWAGIRILTAKESTNYPITLSVDDLGNGFQLTALTVSEIAPERITTYLATAISGLVDALIHNPQQTIHDIPILPAAERQQVLADFNTTQTDFPQEALIHQLFEMQTAQHPEAIAVVYEDQTLSYGELNHRANQLAHYLIALGVHPDDRVALCAERSLEMVVGLLAILKAGGAYVPLDPAYPSERLAYMLEDAAPVALLTQSGLVQSEWLVQFNTLPTVLLDNPEPCLSTQPTSNPDAQALGLASHHLAYVIYTSGSTGQPKGVMIEHQSLCNLITTQQHTLALTANSRVLQFASNSFDACIWESCMALMAGGRLYLAKRADLLPGTILSRYLTEQAISHVLLSPTALAAMDSLPDTLQTLLVGGEACPSTLVKRWSPGRQMLNAYGPTEITVCATLYPCVATAADNPPPIGRPIANTRIYILDAHDQPVPHGVTGEIYIAGAGVARGYLNRPELTAERFLTDPFVSQPDARMYKTGDLGRWLPDGNIEYLGRNDAQVKLRGFRIELGEIEAKLTQCDGVREAVVIAREDEPGQKRLVAYLLPQEGSGLVPAELHQQLAQYLADYMLPSAFVTLDTFPLTPNGKLDRQALPAPDLSAVVTRNYEAPVGEREIILAQIWQKLLGLEQISRHDHFFKLGGHSLIIVSLVEELRNLGWQLEVRSVFSSPVLTDMAQAIQYGSHTFVVPPNRIPQNCTDITPDMLPLVSLSQTEIDAIVEQISGGAMNVQDIYPLSPLQEGILFHHLLQSQGDSYLLRSLLAFDTRTRLDNFLDALQQVINRHDILRTAVYWQGLEQPVQVVWRQAPLTIHEFIPTTTVDIPAQLQDYTDPRQHQIDLNRAPLFATDIAHDPVQNEWLLALRFHHLVSDHMTLELIFAEIAQILQGNAKTLPTMLPYRNFIAQTLHVPAAEHETYFRSQLADIDEPTAPFGILNVPNDNSVINEHRLLLDPTLAKTIRSQARHIGVSPSVLFHVAWGQVLARTSGRDDVVFGSVLLGRLQGGAGADHILGMFINTLPLRITLGGRTARDIVQDTYHNLTALLEHEQAPLALAQRCSGVAQPMPLFSTLLNYRHSQPNTNDTVWDGIRLLLSEERTNYPLTLSVDDLGEAFSISIKSVTTIDPARIADYLVTTISNLVEALMNEPQRPVLGLSILPDAEYQQLLTEFNTTRTDFPQGILIHELFEQQAARTPDATAVVFGDFSFSYHELNRRANCLAHHLITVGVRPDDRIAICVERGLEMMVGLLAILKAGGAYVPLDPTYPAERLAYMIDDAAPVALLTQSAFIDMLDCALPDILLDIQSPALFDKGTENNPDAQTLELTPHHLAYVIYTSGSTGQPKGVMVAHRNVINLHTGLNAALALNPPCRIAMNASIVFDASVKIWLQLLSGHTLIIVPEEIRADSQQLWRYFARHLVDMFDCTPIQLQWLLEAGLGTRAGYQPKLALIGGDSIPPSTWSRLQEIETTRFINVYGPTECTVDATLCPVSSALSQPSIGRPIANTQIYILDTQCQLLPLGVAGEIYIGGTGVARGYLNRPELTAERFLADPFSSQPDARMYKTGDLGRWLPDGNIEYLGRNDFQVKLRGFRIELGEIEAKLTQCDGVREAAVIVREDKPGQKRLVAYLLPQEGVELVPAELRQQLTQYLADYMLPSAFVTLDTFPLTPNGKLDRQALPAPDLSAAVTCNYEAPVGEREIALAQIWQKLLGLEQISRHDHFFKLGGHSLIIVSLVEELRNLGWQLEIRSVFSSPVLTDMAQAIQHESHTFVVPPNRIPENCTAITPDMLPLVSLSQAEIDTLVEQIPGGAMNVQDIYPLAPLQEGILFHHLLQSQGDIYLLRSLLAFDTRTRLDNFLDALQQVINRHDILRTAVYWQGLEQPVQVVWRQAPLTIHEFIPTTTVDIPAQLQAYTDPRQHQINLNQAPLFAIDIAHDPVQNEWILALRFHHLVSDHMTLELIFAEIAQILQGNAKTLPTMLPYRNFIAQTLRVPAAEHETYFRSQLADIDEPTAPFGILDVPNDNSVIDEHRLLLDPTLAKTIRSQVRHIGVSPSVLFHVAWGQVLAQTSGRDDVVFGSVLLGRLQGGAGADRILGMFINTLPVRIQLQARTVKQAVQETYQRLSELLDHEQTPLAIAQRCSGVPASLPLFNSLLNFRHSPRDEEAAHSSVWNGIQVLDSEERSNYPLSLDVDDFDDGFVLTAQCSQQINPVRITAYMKTALEGIVAALQYAPEQPIHAIDILPRAERTQLLETFNDNVVSYPQDALIHQLFEQQAVRTPDAIALVFGENELSYAALNRQANQLAHQLIEAGVRPDDRVAICVDRSLDLIIGLYAILKAGAGYVPLDPEYPAERLAYQLSDSKPVLLLTQHPLQGLLPISDIPVWLLDDESHRNNVAKQPIHNPDIQLQPHHLAYIIYTSGSTGQPKGVMLEHRNVVNFIHAQHQTSEPQSGDRILQFATIAFDTSVSDIFPTLASGATLVLRPAHIRVPDTEFVDLLNKQKITIMDMPTAFWHQWVQEMMAGRSGFGQYLRTVIVGGEKAELRHLISWQSIPETQSCRWINSYGPTETTVIATTLKVDGTSTLSTDITNNIPIGYPLPNTRIYILDTHGRPVPIGVSGEIHIGGAGVARGYLNRPDLTAEKFVADPFSNQPDARMYKTGDLGRWLPDGAIEYLERNDFQVKLRGFRIELGEIEARLTQCDGVREAVVIAREDEPGQKRLVAYLLPQEGSELVPTELRQQLAQYLADYMLPSAFVTLDSFPLTPNGKLDRQAFPVPDQSAFAVRGYESPIDKTEITLAQIWQDLLGLERISRHDHFFELGGHSLLAIQLLNRMREQNMQVSLTTLFAHPTLCDLALTVKKQFVMPVSPFDANPVPLSPTGTLRPLFLVHETSGDPLVYSPLATLLPPELPVYALQALGIHTLEHPPESIEALAACHIQAIRRLQPQGPYRLMGWSIGGLIAYEIAQQLTRDGETVTFLGMIDSYYHTHKNSDNPSVDEEARRIELIISALHTQKMIGDEEALAELHSLSNLEQVLDHCIERQWLSAGITREDILLRVYTADMITQLDQGYIAQKSALPVHLYTAEELVNSDSWHGWHDIVGHDSVLHPIGGTHFSIMHPPLLNQIVDSITENLPDIPSFDPLVMIQQGTPSISPLFCLPGAGASPSSLLELALSFPAQLPVYALQARGFMIEHHSPYRSVEGAARAYIQNIRQIQPHGPYHLLGHSFGGWIAFEIALQLQAEGEQVSELILIDTDEPDQQGSALKSVNRIETIMELIDIYNMILNQPLPLARQDFANLTTDEQIQYLHSALIKAGLFPAKTPISLLQGIVSVMQANLNTSYIPRDRYEGRVHLVNAEEGDKDERRTRETQWRLLVAELDTMVVPGNHMTLLSAPHVEQWVTRLWQNIEKLSQLNG
ncbi:amino acid adenylation domain-containing protein [Xenorhabdus griffiniae]|uniref:Amino acid adenylation domain-containing protein n=7 Tax=Xenorhabdus griffiniae TaxID=351672 RepID=A0ABY9XD50_9GAMM|nr:non-ribosomal peptide synthetase [Xenorhabdus griffiniae]WMV70852.1 amino acid adenylation domain-containing protein [Xenorhabdus griffiniae]WNH00528.1 amino acid adenylation domain-containing protein [Xenorhabdus griffiniae]